MAFTMNIQLIYFLRLLGAALCGAMIGYERESHMKMAGIRTHAIVALASSLMMLISKYGFYDILFMEHIGLDPSRIAAGVVTAVGFLGAGVIFTRHMNVMGITTAAGIWATVGIGMAFGAGMYILSAASIEQITILVDGSEDIKVLLTDIFATKNIKISNITAKRVDAATLEIRLYVRFPEAYDIYDIFQLLKEYPQIKSIDI